MLNYLQTIFNLLVFYFFITFLLFNQAKDSGKFDGLSGPQLVEKTKSGEIKVTELLQAYQKKVCCLVWFFKCKSFVLESLHI